MLGWTPRQKQKEKVHGIVVMYQPLQLLSTDNGLR